MRKTPSGGTGSRIDSVSSVLSRGIDAFALAEKRSLRKTVMMMRKSEEIIVARAAVVIK